MRTVLSLLLAAVVIATAIPAAAQGVIHVPGVATPWPGKIFVAHDEWAMSDYGYKVSRPSANQLVLNLARWFTNGRPGRFLVYSKFYGLIGSEIAATMTGAGHSWTVDATVPFTLATLLQYDAVFVGGTEADNSVLIDYVRAGGNVFLEGGTGLGGDPMEARHWNTFLHAFGLAFSEDYDLTRPAGIYTMTSTSPLFAGVTALYEDTGNPILKLDPNDPNVDYVVAYNGHGLYATYSTRVIPVALQMCQRLANEGDGNLRVSIVGTPDFDVRAVDPGSVRILGVAPFLTTFNYGLGGWRGRLLGRNTPDTCAGGNDHRLDLVLGVHGRDLLRAAEATLGHPLYDDDVVALTLTGRLRRELGGIPIVGETIVVVRGPHRPLLPFLPLSSGARH